jgi:hypothetical protein
MPEAELKCLILRQLQDQKAHPVHEVVEQTIESDRSLYESEVKSTLLGLVRRNQLDLTEDFKVQLPQHELTLVG